MGILSLLFLAPLFFAACMAFIPDFDHKALRILALGGSILTFFVSVGVFVQFKSDTFHFQMVEHIPWVRDLGISYHLGVDGTSIWLVMLTTFLSIITTWFSFYVKDRVKAYFTFMLILEAAMLGVFLSLDLILFFVFFEATLIPMYFLINIWGGARRQYAAIKFFLFTAAGSILMLLGMVTLAWIYSQQYGVWSFDLLALQAGVAKGQFWMGFMQLQAMLFWAFMLAFLVKVPMFPFHTWLPDAHVEAPTAGSVILAGVLLKMGTYGILRFVLPLFPDVIGQAVVPIMVLSVFGIIYGGVVAAVQPDVKKLVAYSSVAHMGFVMLGIFSLTHDGIMGGSVQQLAHGISTGALFLLIGLLYERRHTRLFSDYGGLKAQMPIFSTLFLIVMLSSLGVPGFNGFIGEFLALKGSFDLGMTGQYNMTVLLPAIATTGVIIAAVYLLLMFMKVFYGPNTNPENQRLKDLKPKEIVMVGMLVVFIFWGGLYPITFFKPMEASAHAVRLMAINPAGARPQWAEANQEISSTGSLIEVERSADNKSFEVIKEISPARLKFEKFDPMLQAEVIPQ